MGEARVVRPDRRQRRWVMVDLEGLLPETIARASCGVSSRASILRSFTIRFSRARAKGRPAADPAVLLSLWLYATIEGVGSARELERLAQSEAACRWLAGGVPLNDHGLGEVHDRVASRRL